MDMSDDNGDKKYKFDEKTGGGEESEESEDTEEDYEEEDYEESEEESDEESDEESGEESEEESGEENYSDAEKNKALAEVMKCLNEMSYARHMYELSLDEPPAKKRNNF